MRSGAALGRVLALLGVARRAATRSSGRRSSATPRPAASSCRGLNDYRVELVNIGPDPSPALVWRAALESAARGAATC